jgi:ESCRT-II complex subunit VPS36
VGIKEAIMIQSNEGDDDSVYWSPYNCLIGASLTESGLLQRSAATEVEIYTTIVPTVSPPCIELRSTPESREMMVPLTMSGTVDRKDPKQFRDRTSFPFQIIVTTHRIVLVRDTRKSREARYLHLSNVFSISTESNYFKSSKIILSTAIGELFIAFKKHPDVNPTKLRDECYTQLMNSFEKKQWDIDDQQQTQKDLQRKMITNRKVGVDAILSASQQRHAHAAQITNRAFESSATTPSTGTGGKNQKKKDDLDTFLQEATELVQIIHKYVATLDRSVASSSNNNSSDTDQLVNMLQDMGMTSILNKADLKKRRTKNSSNGGSSSLDVYYDTMARQIVDLIRPKLQQQKVPIMTLTDVYCLYNRSRGTHLISPDDLVAAVERLSDLPHLGVAYVTFPNSGLKVLQDASRTDPTTLTNTFLSLCERHGGYITVLTVSQFCNISSVLAMEQLQMIEQRQVLVRDETLEAIRFYPNRFFR